jgi:hypothetical protein
MTAYDYIRAKWPNHAQRIIEAAYDNGRDLAEMVLCSDCPAYLCPEVLAKLFLWHDTPEGWAYWHTLLVDGEAISLKGRVS